MPTRLVSKAPNVLLLPEPHMPACIAILYAEPTARSVESPTRIAAGMCPSWAVALSTGNRATKVQRMAGRRTQATLVVNHASVSDGRGETR